ncbi:MAG: penicillin-binding transpeptidase domain-containing protein [Candidatus Omnitrophota bacterium]
MSVLTGLFCRIAYLQLVKKEFLSDLASSQHKTLITLEPRRGSIYDRNMDLLAFNIKADSLYAMPRAIPESDKGEISRQLSSILGIKRGFIAERLSRDKAFVWIARKIHDGEAKKIKDLELEGIGILEESKRCYPHSYLASHILGFAGIDNNGLEGLEMWSDKYLKGRPGFRLTTRDAKRRLLSSKDEKYLSPVDGHNIILTIDSAIQHITESCLDRAFRKYRAEAATIIVMDPNNGQILAMANRPTYDLSMYANAGPDERRNRAVSDVFEPGSVFKIILASCVLEKGVVSPDDKFFCENGKYWVGGRCLHDHKPHGTLTFRQVIEKSSNIGTVKAAKLLKEKDFFDFIKKFGFGEKTGVDMPGEVEGILSSPSKWSKTSMTAIPIGHEVAVTAVQLASAVSAAANGGTLYRPWIIKEIRDNAGVSIRGFEAKAVREVISEGTSKTLRGILKGVVEDGTGKAAALESYTSAGKTGTAQKINPDGTYSHAKYLASFVGFAPADDPKVTIVVCFDEPKPVYYGGVVAAPVFKEVAEEVLRYLEVSPDKGRPDKQNIILADKAG